MLIMMMMCLVLCGASFMPCGASFMPSELISHSTAVQLIKLFVSCSAYVVTQCGLLYVFARSCRQML